jgi:hypothetical protein
VIERITTPAGQVFALSGPISAGTYELGTVSFPFASPLPTLAGCTTLSRSNAGTNAQGKECVDERWIQARVAGGEWTPIGGGLDGDTIDLMFQNSFEVRLVIPDGASTTGDFVANIELFYPI